jgi:ATP-binding cassette subfamily B multidrug efflux pump
VQQDVFLFSDTVTDNISFGLSQTAGKEKVEQAAGFPACTKRSSGFSEGYETMIGERGVTLSGGQKQRISIARALIKEPEIVVFDDCLSAVDAKTEHEIISNLYRYLHDKTAVIITHRIFSSFRFDNIIVLDNGELAEQGTHEELMAKQRVLCGVIPAAAHRREVGGRPHIDRGRAQTGMIAKSLALSGQDA